MDLSDTDFICTDKQEENPSLVGTILIDIHGIVKNFGSIRALDGLDLAIEPGIFGLIGPNGAGKTTLISILLGLIQPTAGSAHVFGLDAQKKSLEIRKRVGVLHENLSLPVHMSAHQYLSEVIGIYESDKDPNRLLSMVGLGHAAHRKIGDFSAGMRQRMGIALALAADGELVFLDEPTANLDVPGREEILNQIVQLHRESGVSFMISSHILSELEKACTHVAFIHRGKIVEQGKTLEVIRKHTGNRYRILCSDSSKIVSKLREITGVTSVRSQGPNTVSITVTGDSTKVRGKIQATAQSLSVELYSMERAATLEDAFWDVIT